MNTSPENILIKQLLLVAELYQVNVHLWQYNTMMDQESNSIKMRYQPIPLADIRAGLNHIGASENNQGDQLPKEPEDPHPKFDPKPDLDRDIDFQKVDECLPFWLNMGDAPLNEKQGKWLLDIIYANQEVSSLSDEDLGLCDHLYHSIPTNMDKPVYLPHPNSCNMKWVSTWTNGIGKV